MSRKIKLFSAAVIAGAAAFCIFINPCQERRGRYDFPQILDISYTPTPQHRCTGWFTDAGSWMGFTPPQASNWVNGFCGPFSLDMNRRSWLAKSAVEVSFQNDTTAFLPDSSSYFPGELYISAHSSSGAIEQRLNFINSSTALLRINSSSNAQILLTGKEWGEGVIVRVGDGSVVGEDLSGEKVLLSFPKGVSVQQDGNNYVASAAGECCVAVSFVTQDDDIGEIAASAQEILSAPKRFVKENTGRWNGYLASSLRNGRRSDLDAGYDRIAVKAVTTLISNWRVARGDLLHDGIVPSHAAWYFVGFWAWDSWRFSAALASIAPELAKDNMRAMFDWQLPDGMVIDCIYTDKKENNERNSKPPLACWAADRIYEHTGDKEFLSEMYPKLLSYYKWWYSHRDHDGNGICEYGATDGTLEAAAWESGMDNAIRFDSTAMLSNSSVDNPAVANAWSMDQESVDLNAYLALEYTLLKKFARILDMEFDAPCAPVSVADYFFCKESSFFHDRKIGTGEFIKEAGCEAYTPLWTGIASAEQVERMLPQLLDTAKFSTYIPFPTISADNPKYNPKGYWRGPIWLDQTYFAIKGLRNYGYNDMANSYTLKVFDRLAGLKEGAPIHENYGTHNGNALKAPHFSWSAAHLLMLYWDYGR